MQSFTPNTGAHLWACGPLDATVTIRRVDLDLPPGALLGALAAQDDPAVLESAAIHDQFGRYTILACRPLDVITLEGGVLSSRRGALAAGDDDAIWSALSQALSAVQPVGQVGECEYLPGWIGYIGYEVGRHVEKLPSRSARDTSLPDLRLALYDAMLVYDGLDHTWSITELKFAKPALGAGRGGKALRRIVSEAREAADEDDHRPQPEHAAARQTARVAKSNFTPDEYRAAIARCIDYIAAGDIFQVNMSQRFTVHNAPDALSIYRSLRRGNPAWYAAFLAFQADGRQCAVVSSSPELFLRVRGNKVTTRPIKGTRRRVGNPQADRKAAQDLSASEKDNAELAMIIDLLRNDLGRVCRFGSVRVTEPCRLETHPTVFHLVGTVEGLLRDGVGPAELLRATFPGGSVTGAPKIRAMEIIDELETPARGVYTGCIGYVGADGSAEWNIAIRTVVCDESEDGRNVAHVQVGGGIVADSSPEGEYQETLDKARALLEAIAEAQTSAVAAGAAPA